jgi:hypothetical protein
MRKWTTLIGILFVALLLICSNNLRAETGNACPGTPTGENDPEWRGTIVNKLDHAVTIKVPRNEWVCFDWFSIWTPAKLDNLEIPAGQSVEIALYPKYTWRTDVTPFTFKLWSQGNSFGTQVSTFRIALNKERSGGIAYFYLYGPAEWVSEGSPKYRGTYKSGNKFARVKFETIRIDDRSMHEGVRGRITFEYQ